MKNISIPHVVFRTRIRDESLGGDNPFRWQDVTSNELFGGRRVVVFSLPGAFTPVCSVEQGPAFERHYDIIRTLGIDDILCVSVNDAFVMHQWGQHLGIERMRLVPDGAGHFTRRMGMLIDKGETGFGWRSWRYAMVVDNGVVEAWFEEPGIDEFAARTDPDDDPYEVTSPEHIMAYLRSVS